MTFSRLLRAGTVAVLLTVLLGVPALSFAQETRSAAVDAPLVSLESMPIQAQVWLEAEPNANVMIVGSGLPTDTPLPARVQLPVPEGAQLIWAGEIGGAGPESDIEASATIVPVAGGQAVEFVVSQYRVFQYEVYIDPPQAQGNRVTSALNWVQSLPATALSVAWRVPAGVTDIELSPDAPGTPQVNEAGERLYTLATLAPAVGDEVVFNVNYTFGSTAAEGGGVDPLTIVLILLAVAVLALIVVVTTERTRRAADLEE